VLEFIAWVQQRNYQAYRAHSPPYTFPALRHID